jgi:hypothetical protein
MTLLMFIVACGVRTPVAMWMLAMACDTILGVTFMILRSQGKL